MSDNKDKEAIRKSKEKEAIRKEKIKKDKIFNNRYKYGDGIREDEDRSNNTAIAADHNYSDNYLKDVYDSENSMDYSIGVGKIFNLIEKDRELNALLRKIGGKVKLKLSKEQINWAFRRMLTTLNTNENREAFYNPIYVLEALSSILSIGSPNPIKDYKKIFDSLEADLQEELLIELNKKYKFLDGKMNTGKIH